ncbi:MAG: hypothetical protein H7Y20_06690 [Bryobacteraceae bacterium]|nr:hypothetical protein [Bryobacteraceae bacterium]
MHEPVKGRLEDYLRGGGPFPEVEAHLRVCQSCQAEVASMRSQSLLLRSLQVSEDLEPSPGFYGRVMSGISSQARPSVWNLFGESVFAKRLAFASASFLLLLGSFLITPADTDQTIATGSPEAVLAGSSPDDQDERITLQDPEKDREAVLVNLASWRQGYQ